MGIFTVGVTFEVKGVAMLEDAKTGTEPDFVEFHATGADAKGEFHCSECGYGVTIHTTLPACPMCGGRSWEQSAWSPLTRAATLV